MIGMMNEAVTAYIEKIGPQWQAEICKTLRQSIHEALPDVDERLQYSKPHYLKNGKYAFVYSTAKGWVSFTIFNAKSLETPAGLFEASEDGERKTIKIREGQTVDYAVLSQLIRVAVNVDSQ